MSTVEARTSTSQNTVFLAGIELARRILVTGEVSLDVQEPAEVVDADAVVAHEAEEQPRHADDQDRPDEVVQRLGERREPGEQRVADERQQHRLAERQDEPGDRERHPDDRDGPVGVAVHRRKALDDAVARLARRRRIWPRHR